MRAHYRRLFRPRGTIVSVAGNIEWEPLRDQVGRLFGDWQGDRTPPLTLGHRARSRAHLQRRRRRRRSASPTRACRSATPTTTPPSGAVNVLSGGMSRRLFTEVREKRGLCYSVWASYSDVQGPGQRHLLRRHHERARPGDARRDARASCSGCTDGIEAEEVERVQAGLKSSLIMQEESTSSRAGALASDWYYLGRVRSFDEIKSAIDGLTPDGIIDHVGGIRPKDFTIVTLGPQPLT